MRWDGHNALSFHSQWRVNDDVTLTCTLPHREMNTFGGETERLMWSMAVISDSTIDVLETCCMREGSSWWWRISVNKQSSVFRMLRERRETHKWTQMHVTQCKCNDCTWIERSLTHTERGDGWWVGEKVNRSVEGSSSWWDEDNQLQRNGECGNNINFDGY